MGKLLSTLFLVLIFGIIPILGWPFLLASEAIRVGLLVIVVCLYQLIASFNPKLIYHHLPLFFLFCYLAILTALQFGRSDLQLQLFGQAPFHQGLILFWAIFVLVAVVIKTPTARYIPMILMTSGLYLALIAITQFIMHRFLHLPVPLYVDRVVSTLGQPSWYSGFLLVLIPIAFAVKHKLYPRYIAFIIMLIFVLAIIISASATSILMMIFLITGYLLYRLSTYQKLISIIILLYLANLLFAQPFNHFQGKVNKYLAREITQPFYPKLFDDTYSAEKRSLLWVVGFQIARDQPFTGYGLNSIPDAYKKFDYQTYFYYQNSSFGPPRLQHLYISSSHNIFLDQLIQGGVVQLIFFVLLLTIIYLYLPIGILRLSFLLWITWLQFQLPSIVHWLLFAYFIIAANKGIDNHSKTIRQ